MAVDGILQINREIVIKKLVNVNQHMEKYPRWLKGHPWKGCRSLIAARGFKSLLLRSLKF